MLTFQTQKLNIQLIITLAVKVSQKINTETLWTTDDLKGIAVSEASYLSSVYGHAIVCAQQSVTLD
jgi:hypothetical protein